MIRKITIATFDTMPDAHIAMGRLQAAGIACWLADENMVQTDWLYSIAVGGIKLQVEQTDIEDAMQELAIDYTEADHD